MLMRFLISSVLSSSGETSFATDKLNAMMVDAVRTIDWFCERMMMSPASIIPTAIGTASLITCLAWSYSKTKRKNIVEWIIIGLFLFGMGYRTPHQMLCFAIACLAALVYVGCGVVSRTRRSLATGATPNDRLSEHRIADRP